MFTLPRGPTRAERRLGFGDLVIALSVPVCAEATSTGRRRVGAGHPAARAGERGGAREHGGAAAASGARHGGQRGGSFGMSWNFGKSGLAGEGSARAIGALRGGRPVLPPGGPRLLPLEPDQQPLAREADDAAATQHRHRGVLQRPALDGLLVDAEQIGDLPGGEVGRVGIISGIEFLG